MPELYIREPYYSQIQRGEKTIEGRIASKTMRALDPGETLTFIKGRSGQRTPTQIESLHIYAGFAAMLEEEDISALLPGVTDVEEGVAIYHKLPHFEQRAQKSGVIAIRFSLESGQ